MGQMKKINELFDKYNKLKGREKSAVKESMEALKNYVEDNKPEYEAFGCQYKECDKPIAKQYDTYCYEHDQINELDNKPPNCS